MFLLMQQSNIFWSKIGPGFGEQGGTSPPRTPRDTPRGLSLPRSESCCESCCESGCDPEGGAAENAGLSLALIAQKVDSAMHRINYYPVLRDRSLFIAWGEDFRGIT